jgi:hypothetical protein
MITIFSIPKPYVGHIATIQSNALKSWISLKPACEVILCGNEPGVEEAARRFGVKHIPHISCNEYGTPLLNSAFAKVAEASRDPYLCYVNTDIILFSDMLQTVQRIQADQFLMIGKRHNVEISHEINLECSDWESQVRKLAQTNGQLASQYYMDYFVFTRNEKLEEIPPFVVGRPRWDSWFVYHALSLGLRVVDATQAVMAIHQNHDYAHIPKKNKTPSDVSELDWEGPEAIENRQLSFKNMNNSSLQFTVYDSTHVMTPKYILPAFSPKYLKRRWHSLTVFYPFLKPLIEMVNKLISLSK